LSEFSAAAYDPDLIETNACMMYASSFVLSYSRTRLMHFIASDYSPKASLPEAINK